MLSDTLSGAPWKAPSPLCEFISSAMIPVHVEDNSLFWRDYYSDIRLQWDHPDCRYCEYRGGRCGLAGVHDLISVACYDLPTTKG
ncbi:hypothetical protein TSUD_71530 [Trifolium subterraneum]|uniref:Wall-associated receptor kinase C-terminal domain-containing protein n=1 Tax=Trifolium subterraneum TaxID=3900 RepID=A0A2Z6N9H6_TRISU|nr:hypothetical protein TSUD_71530 [Trifolium subterraneum]